MYSVYQWDINVMNVHEHQTIAYISNKIKMICTIYRAYQYIYCIQLPNYDCSGAPLIKVTLYKYTWYRRKYDLQRDVPEMISLFYFALSKDPYACMLNTETTMHIKESCYNSLAIISLYKIHSFILNIYIAPLQENYSEALPTPARLKRAVLSW